MTNFIKIEEVSGENKNKVHQALRFQTGKFVWRIKFNLPLKASSVNNQTCFVTSASGAILKANIHYKSEGNYIEVEPQEAYSKEQSYFLHVTTQVTALNGKKLKQEIQIKFKVQP